ncbi:nitrate reductase [Bowmanella denitrificans]|uniref:Nitrate reductase n=1 Tax=Bowmanella denitrificans TaxID=366582 RepID=A0ABP3H4W1_9ALTE
MQAAARLCATTCPYCGVGCGVDAQLSTDAQGQKYLDGVHGTQNHPANYGRLCIKGSKLPETNGLQGRLLSPTIYGQPTSWQQAIDTAAQGFTQAIQKYGPDSVAIYVSGQLLTEDYYLANKLMKGYIGSANIDTNSRLCMSSAVAGYKRAFGADAMPCCYDDLEQTELLVLVGSNAAWTHPVLYQRMERARAINPALKLVVIDPRKTATAEQADLFLPIKAGTDVALFNGLLAYLAEHQGLDQAFIRQHTQGFAATLDCARDWTVAKVAQLCELDSRDIRLFYRWFCNSPSALSFFSMGVNQSSSGTDKVNAIINCHLASGKIGKPGSGPFSVTGQPNAMGGREVGGLATMLAAHLDIQSERDRQLLQQYWQSPAMVKAPGLPALQLFSQMAKGKIKALWIMGTNPMVSLPDRQLVAQALGQCELVVVSDAVANNDTLAFAHIALPACPWSEKDGTVTNSERRISRQRGFLVPAGQAKPDWQILCEFARAMGFSGFDYAHPSDIFAEYARLTGLANQGQRALDISGLAGLTQRQYEQLSPIQWPVNSHNPQGCKRLFSDGHFYTQSGRANFVPLTYQPPKQLTSEAFPWVLNSGRVRDQWHSMTRTGTAPELLQHQDRPWLAMHPEDAAVMGLQEGQLVKLRSKCSGEAQVMLQIKLESSQRRGELFAPMHWNQQFCSHGAIGALFAAVGDPLSFQPELKHAAVAVLPQHFSQYAILLCRNTLSAVQLNQLSQYWLRLPLAGGQCYLLAGKDRPDWQGMLSDWLGAEQGLGRSGQHTGYVALHGQALHWAWQISELPWPVLPSAWLQSMLDNDALDDTELSAWLRAQPPASFMQGRQVCSCFKVHEQAICQAINDGHNSVQKLGKYLGCGTGCGSCKPELAKLVSSQQPASASRLALETQAAIIFQEAI